MKTFMQCFKTAVFLYSTVLWCTTAPHPSGVGFVADYLPTIPVAFPWFGVARAHQKNEITALLLNPYFHVGHFCVVLCCVVLCCVVLCCVVLRNRDLGQGQCSKKDGPLLDK